jgi:hypothetical protein
MILSNANRFVFVEFPLTGSTAISAELRANYGGVQVLHKHARYHEFLAAATPEQRKYFVFGGIRNPLDEAVSHYFKFKSNHKGELADPEQRSENGGWVTHWHVERFDYVQRTGAAFAPYFLHFYKRQYDSWVRLHHRRFNHVIRFEQLAQGFDAALRTMGLEPVRPLPVMNKTEKGADDFLAPYTPDTHQRAAEVFGPFMEEWGYSLPSEWRVTVPSLPRLIYRLTAPIRRQRMLRYAAPHAYMHPKPRDVKNR